MNKIRLLLGIACFLHLAHIVAVNSSALLGTYKQLYQHPSVDRYVPASFYSGWPQQLYGTLSGTLHGYGFFAPNVASQYISQFTLYDRNGRVLKHFQTPTIYSLEGLQRYSVWLDQFQRYLSEQAREDQAATLYRRYLQASLSTLCRQLLHQEAAAARIDCLIYLHQPSLLKQGPKASPSMIPIYQYSSKSSL